MTTKMYCLKCEKPNMGCKCISKEYSFTYSYKLRVPLSTSNKVVFRKFLDECPQFVNMVPDELIPHFRNLLIKVKFFNKTINGREFTLVSENEKFNNKMYSEE